MKLKERPLDWWKGRSFSYWCKADQNDSTKINYTLNWFSIGDGWTVMNFTSDEYADGHLMYMLNKSSIHEIRKENNEWFVELDYPFYYKEPEKDESVLKTRHIKSIH